MLGEAGEDIVFGDRPSFKSGLSHFISLCDSEQVTSPPQTCLLTPCRVEPVAAPSPLLCSISVKSSQNMALHIVTPK